MSDRELLEKAARAAGYSVSFAEGTTLADGPNIYYMHDRGWPHPDREGSHWWNPLADDGDALRLAVKLRMLIQTEAGGSFLERGIEAYCKMGLTEGQAWFAEEEGIADPYAATRRAIVRAAAAMGEA